MRSLPDFESHESCGCSLTPLAALGTLSRTRERGGRERELVRYNNRIPENSMRSSPKPRAWLWLSVLIPLAAVGTAALLLGVGYVFNVSGESEPLGVDERALLLDIEHLVQWTDGYEPVVDRENVSKTRFLDDSYELEYSYDVLEDDDSPYLAYSITFEGNEGDARTTYLSFWGGTHAGFLLGEVQFDIDERADLFSWGDESRFGILKADGRPFGNVFLARSGTRVVYFLVAGLYFDESRSVEALLVPYLERLNST